MPFLKHQAYRRASEADGGVYVGLRVYAAVPGDDQILSLSNQLDGNLIRVEEENFDYASTLQDYLRRGGSAFEASEPG